LPNLGGSDGHLGGFWVGNDGEFLDGGVITILKNMSSSKGQYHPIYEMETKTCLKPPTSFGGCSLSLMFTGGAKKQLRNCFVFSP
jgi:hypothetical protein